MKFVRALLALCLIAVSAIADVVSVSPSKLDFGNHLVAISSTQAAILANPTKKALNIFSVSADGDFSVFANPCGATLPAGNQCAISIAFVPTAAVPRTGTLTIVDDSNDSAQKVATAGSQSSASLVETRVSGPQFLPLRRRA